MSVDYQSGGLPYRLPVKGSSINWRKGGEEGGGVKGSSKFFTVKKVREGKRGENRRRHAVGGRGEGGTGGGGEEGGQGVIQIFHSKDSKRGKEKRGGGGGGRGEGGRRGGRRGEGGSKGHP